LAEPGTNMLRSVFLKPDLRERYADPEWVLATAVAFLRANVGGDADDPDLNDLVAELSLASEDFRRLWARHDVQSVLSGDTLFLHPVVGAMRLRDQTFAVHGADQQTLLVVHTAPRSEDERALTRLAALAAEPDGRSPRFARAQRAPLAPRFLTARVVEPRPLGAGGSSRCQPSPATDHKRVGHQPDPCVALRAYARRV
jgi:hypothetical protein